MTKEKILLNTEEKGGERMTRVKYIVFIMILLVSILLLAPNISRAAEVKVTRNIYSNNGSMKFNFTGLTLDMSHDYEYGFTKTATSEVEKWYLITEKTATTATVDIISTDKTLRKVVDAVDTGYITIRDKVTQSIVLKPYAVDLKVPFLRVTNYTVIPNGKEFGTGMNDTINVVLSNRDNCQQPYYQYEKITDQNVINKYKEIKRKNGDFMELEKILKTAVPTSNWSIWTYWNGYESTGGGHGKPETPIKVPDSGLYYMWLYFEGKDGTKNRYGYILVDNLEPDIALEGISIPKTATVEINGTLTLTPTFNPSNATNKIVTWSSSDETVATVDNAGRITPKKIGSTIITVVSQDGNKRATCTVTVTGKANNPGNNTNNAGQNKGETSGNNSSTNNKPTTDNNSSTNNQGTLNIGNANKENANTNEKKNDPTTAKGSLPQTGESAILVIAMLLAGLAGIGYVKYKKYQDIK